MLNILKKIKDTILHIYLWAAAMMLLVLTVSCCIQAIARYLLPSSPPWTEELARFSFIWFSALGAAAALDRGLHAAITVIVDKLPPSLHRIARIGTLLIILFLAGLLIYSGILLSAATFATPSTSLRLPLVYVHSSIIFCGFGMGISSLYSLFALKDVEGGTE